MGKDGTLWDTQTDFPAAGGWLFAAAAYDAPME
jgi:hypothetical protein